MFPVLNQVFEVVFRVVKVFHQALKKLNIESLFLLVAFLKILVFEKIRITLDLSDRRYTQFFDIL